jgi:xanthine dehydrogenase iron-sulfur cluster and FAD-binding subunit A
MPLLNLRQLRVRRLVDLGAIAELQSIETGPDGELIIGACITMSRLQCEPAVLARAPLLDGALRLVANPQVRARGTIGGNVAHRDAVSELWTALVVLQAKAAVRGPAGERLVPVESLELADDELIISLRIPPATGPNASAIHEVAPRYAARALVVAAAVTETEADLLTDVRIAVGGVAHAPTVLSGMDALRGLGVEDARVDTIITAALHKLSAEESYRRDAASQLAARALRSAATKSCPSPSFVSRRPPATRVLQAMQERDSASEITISVNGERVHTRVEPRLLLCDLLRGRLGLHATHVGCEHGVCGACNVLLDGIAVRSCLMLAVQADGRCVETLEGLRDTDEVGELIDAFVNRHALQCGFCTPGFLITLSELRAQGLPIRSERLLGNLCRCTGYAPIRRVAEDLG